jgi:hypothetical protein
VISAQDGVNVIVIYPDQTKALGARNRLRPCVDGELHENVLYMRFDRFRSDSQFPCDLLVGSAVADTLKNIVLAGAQ